MTDLSNLLEHKKFVAIDITDNNARFWEYKFFSDDTVQVSYGRLGITRTEDPPKPMTRRKLDSLIKTKTRATKDRPAYKEVEIVGEVPKASAAGVIDNVRLKELAKQEIAGTDPVLQDLVTRLAEANKHELLESTGGAIDIDLSTGIVSTELGVVSLKSISAARLLLNDMSSFVMASDLDNKTYLDALNQYLTLVPQRAPLHRGWHRSFIQDSNGLQKQNILLDQLETSVDLVQKRIADAEAAALNPINGNVAPRPSMFDTTVKVVTDQRIIDEVTAFFNKGVHSVHTSSALKPIRIYEVAIKSVKDGYESLGKKLDNKMRLWHGTRTFNVLSMLKRGPVVPPASAAHVSGRMFGDGFYMSDQSSKSLNYSQGYWSGARDNRCFMFLCEAAMGTIFKPTRSGDAMKAGYNSCFAEAGKSGVMNNEMIVWDTRQVDIQFLIEFGPK